MALEIEITSNSKQAQSDLNRLNKSVDRIADSAERTSSTLSTTFTILAAGATALVGAAGLKGVTDSFTRINNQIALTTGRTNRLIVTQTKLLNTSRRVRVQLEETTNLYSSLARNTKLSADESLKLTEVLLKAAKIGGGSAQTISGSLIQLQQGLASGVLRGQELNSVLEGTPRIAQAIAKELDVDIGQLRRLAEQGKVTARVVQRALLGAADEIDEEYSKINVTISNAFSNARREIGVGINDIFKVLNTGRLGPVIERLGVAIGETLSTLAVRLRVLQTEFLLIRLRLAPIIDDLAKLPIDTFDRITSMVVRFTDRLKEATSYISDFAQDVKDIFYDLYIYVVGASVWPDLIIGVISWSKTIFKAIAILTAFKLAVLAIFTSIVDIVFDMPLFTSFSFLFQLELAATTLILEGYWSRIKKAIVSNHNAVANSTRDFISAIRNENGELTKFGEGVKKLANQTAVYWSDFIDNALSSASSTISSVLSYIGNFASNIGGVLNDVIDDLKRAITLIRLLPAIINIEYGDKIRQITDQIIGVSLDAISGIAGTILIFIGLAAAAAGNAVLATLTIGLGGFLKGFSKQLEEENLFGDDAIPLEEELRKQTNILQKVSDGIGSLIQQSTQIFGVDEGLLADAIEFISENLVGTLTALYFSKEALRLGGGGLSRLLFPNPEAGASSLYAARGVRAGSEAFRGLEQQLTTLEADLGGLKEASRASQLQLKSGTITQEQYDAAKKESQKIEKGIIRQQQTLRDQVRLSGDIYRDSTGRIAKAASAGAAALGTLGASIGGVFGGIAGSFLATEFARKVGANSAQQFVITLATYRLGEVIGSSLLGYIAGRLGGILATATALAFSPGGIAILLKPVGTLIVASWAKAMLLVRTKLLATAILAGSRYVAITSAGTIAASIKGALAWVATMTVGLLPAMLRAASLFVTTIIGASSLLTFFVGASLAAAVVSAFRSSTVRQIGSDIGKALFEAIGDIREWDDIAANFAKKFFAFFAEGYEEIVAIGTDIGKKIIEALTAFDAKTWFFGAQQRQERIPVESGSNPSNPGFAMGGRVIGPGTGTSDDIPVLLSNGEYVIRERVASRYLPFLEALNRTGRLPRFATGGLVGNSGNINSSDILDSLLESITVLIKSAIGEENFSSAAGFLASVKTFFQDALASFNKPDEEPTQEFFDTISFAAAIKDLIQENTPNAVIDTTKLREFLDDNAKETQNLLALFESGNKVQQEIARLTKQGLPVSLDLLTQQRVIGEDIIGRLGELVVLQNENNALTKQISEFSKTQGEVAAGEFRDDFQGGLTSLLKGESDLGDFGTNLFESFRDKVIESLSAGITEGIFGGEEGQGGLQSRLSGLFGKVTQTGENIGEGLSALGSSAAKPLWVQIVGSGGKGDPLDIALPGGTEGLPEGGADPTGSTTGEIPAEGTSAAETAAGGVESGGEKAAGGFKQVFESFTSKFSSIFDGLIGKLGGFLGSIANTLGSLFSSIGSGIGSFFGLFFHNGGLVPDGGGYHKLNGGEMVLTEAQQTELFAAAKGNTMRSDSQNQVVNNIHITGDISRQTKKEIIQMLPTIAGGVNQYNRENLR